MTRKQIRYVINNLSVSRHATNRIKLATFSRILHYTHFNKKIPSNILYVFYTYINTAFIIKISVVIKFFFLIFIKFQYLNTVILRTIQTRSPNIIFILHPLFFLFYYSNLLLNYYYYYYTLPGVRDNFIKRHILSGVELSSLVVFKTDSMLIPLTQRSYNTLAIRDYGYYTVISSARPPIFYGPEQKPCFLYDVFYN